MSVFNPEESETRCSAQTASQGLSNVSRWGELGGVTLVHCQCMLVARCSPQELHVVSNELRTALLRGAGRGLQLVPLRKLTPVLVVNSLHAGQTLSLPFSVGAGRPVSPAPLNCYLATLGSAKGADTNHKIRR